MQDPLVLHVDTEKYEIKCKHMALFPILTPQISHDHFLQ